MSTVINNKKQGADATVQNRKSMYTVSEAER